MEDYLSQANRNIYANPVFHNMSDSEQQKEISLHREEYLRRNPDANPDEVNAISNDRNRQYRQALGLGRAMPEQFLQENNIILPSQKKGYEDLSLSEKEDEIKMFRENIKGIASKNPSQKDDTEYFLNQRIDQVERRAYGEDTGPVADKAKRFLEGAGATFFDGLNMPDAADEVRRYVTENPEYDETFMSQLSGGAGSILSAATVMAAAAGATSFAGGSGALAAGAGLTASLAHNSGMRYNEAYRKAVNAGLDDETASAAGWSAMPAAVIDTVADKFLLGGKVFSKAGAAAYDAASASGRAAMVAEAMANNSIRNQVTRLASGALIEGSTEAVGDYYAGLMPFLTTDNKEFLQTDKEALMAFTIGGILGGGISAPPLIADTVGNKAATRTTAQAPMLPVTETTKYGTKSQMNIAESAKDAEAMQDPINQNVVYDLIAAGKYKDARIASVGLLKSEGANRDAKIKEASDAALAAQAAKDAQAQADADSIEKEKAKVTRDASEEQKKIEAANAVARLKAESEAKRRLIDESNLDDAQKLQAKVESAAIYDAKDNINSIRRDVIRANRNLQKATSPEAAESAQKVLDKAKAKLDEATIEGNKQKAKSKGIVSDVGSKINTLAEEANPESGIEKLRGESLLADDESKAQQKIIDDIDLALNTKPDSSITTKSLDDEYKAWRDQADKAQREALLPINEEINVIADKYQKLISGEVSRVKKAKIGQEREAEMSNAKERLGILTESHKAEIEKKKEELRNAKEAVKSGGKSSKVEAKRLNTERKKALEAKAKSDEASSKANARISEIESSAPEAIANSKAKASALLSKARYNGLISIINFKKLISDNIRAVNVLLKDGISNDEVPYLNDLISENIELQSLILDLNSSLGITEVNNIISESELKDDYLQAVADRTRSIDVLSDSLKAHDDTQESLDQIESDAIDYIEAVGYAISVDQAAQVLDATTNDSISTNVEVTGGSTTPPLAYVNMSSSPNQSESSPDGSAMIIDIDLNGIEDVEVQGNGVQASSPEVITANNNAEIAEKELNNDETELSIPAEEIVSSDLILADVGMATLDPSVTPTIEAASLPIVDVNSGGFMTSLARGADASLSFTQYLEDFIRSSKSSESSIDRMIRDIIEKNPSLRIVDQGLVGCDGLYNMFTDTIHIDTRTLRVIGHEVSHALTQKDLYKYVTSRRESSYSKKLESALADPGTPLHIVDLIKVYKYASGHLKASGFIGRSYDGRMTIEQYSFTSLDEFLAEAMSNGEFQDKLSSIPYEGSTLWDKIVKIFTDTYDWIQSIAAPEYVMRSKGNNSLNAALSAAHNIIYQSSDMAKALAAVKQSNLSNSNAGSTILTTSPGTRIPGISPAQQASMVMAESSLDVNERQSAARLMGFKKWSTEVAKEFSERLADYISSGVSSIKGLIKYFKKIISDYSLLLSGTIISTSPLINQSNQRINAKHEYSESVVLPAERSAYFDSESKPISNPQNYEVSETKIDDSMRKLPSFSDGDGNSMTSKDLIERLRQISVDDGTANPASWNLTILALNEGVRKDPLLDKIFKFRAFIHDAMYPKSGTVIGQMDKSIDPKAFDGLGNIWDLEIDELINRLATNKHFREYVNTLTYDGRNALNYISDLISDVEPIEKSETASTVGDMDQSAVLPPIDTYNGNTGPKALKAGQDAAITYGDYINGMIKEFPEYSDKFKELIDDISKKSASLRIVDQKVYGFAGLHDSESNVIHMSGRNPYILTHEIAHALTSNDVYTHVKSRNSGTYLDKINAAREDVKTPAYIKNLIDIYLHSANSLGRSALIGVSASRLSGVELLESYGFTSLDEFIAESRSSDTFRDKLSTVFMGNEDGASDEKLKTGVWDRILAILKKTYRWMVESKDPTSQNAKSRRSALDVAASSIRGGIDSFRSNSSPSALTSSMLDWITSTHDNDGMPFAIADKSSGVIHYFNKDGSPRLAESASFGVIKTGNPSSNFIRVNGADLISGAKHGSRIDVSEESLSHFKDGGYVYILPETEAGKALFKGFTEMENNISFLPSFASEPALTEKQKMAKRAKLTYSRARDIAKGNINDKHDSNTSQIAKALASLKLSDVSRLSSPNLKKFSQLIDNVYESRKSAVVTPQSRNNTTEVIKLIKKIREVMDARFIADTIAAYDGIIDFNSLGIDMTDRASIEKAVNDSVRANNFVNIAARAADKEAELQKKCENWRDEYPNTISLVKSRFGDAKNYLSELIASEGNVDYIKANADFLVEHFNYLTKADVSKMEGLELYQHSYALRNLLDGSFGYFALTSNHIAKQRNKDQDVRSFAKRFRDPVWRGGKMLAVLDWANRKTELHQVELQRVSASKDVRSFVQDYLIGPMYHGVIKVATNQIKAYETEYLAYRKEILGDNPTSEDVILMAIFGRLTQYQYGSNADAQLLVNINKERVSLANSAKYSKTKQGAQYFNEVITPIFEDAVKDIEEYGDGAMDHFVSTLDNRMRGTGGAVEGRNRKMVLAKQQEIFSRFTSTSKMISEGFYGKLFEGQVLYIPNQVISSKSDEAEMPFRLNEEINTTNVKRGVKNLNNRAGHYDDRQVALTGSQRYSYNSEEILSSGVRRLSVDHAVAAEKMILSERLKEGSDLNNIISLDELGEHHQDRVDFIEGMAVKLINNAISVNPPAGDLVGALRHITSAVAKPQLSSIHHIVTQPIAAFVDYASRTGDVKGWLSALRYYTANSSKLDKWLADNASWVSDRSILEVDGLVAGRVPDTSGKVDSKLMTGAKKVYEVAGDIMTFSMRHGDDYSAKATLIAEYARLMKEKRGDFGSLDNLDLDNIDSELMTTAILESEKIINTSNKALRSALFSDREVSTTVIRSMLVAFASHSASLASQVAQSYRNAKDLKAMGAPKEEIAAEYRLIASILAQQITFTSARFYLGGLATTATIGLIQSMFGYDDDDIAKKQARLYEAQQSGNRNAVIRAEHELANAKNVFSVTSKMRNNTQSADSLFKQIIRDGTGAFNIAFNNGLVQKAIFMVPDGWMGEMTKAGIEAESTRLDIKIKKAKEIGDYRKAASLVQQKEILSSAVYIPFAYDNASGMGMGGAYGAVADIAGRGLSEANRGAMGVSEYSWNDLAIAMTAAGLGQADISKTMKAFDKVQNEFWKENDSYQKKLSEDRKKNR
jgi:hypothetical protein